MRDFSRGSEWRKWDLHVHTPYTHMNSYTCSDDTFIDELVKKEISCIGLTNYFNFKEEEYRLKEKIENNQIKVFLNLELRLDYQNKDDDCLDLHVIFSDNVTKQDIEKLLQNLSANVSGNKKKLIVLQNKEDFKNAVVNFDELLQCLNDESLSLKEKYLIGFLSRGKGNARSSSNYEKITRRADFLIHSSDDEKNISEDTKFWLSYNKPVIQSSDAHDVNTIGTKFTWIKAEPTFEGLKQIIYEPERVKIQEEKPEIKTAYEVIKSIKIIDPKNIFTSDKIGFSSNLNSIIGGKSSGKSLLLFLLAKTVLTSERFEEIKKYENFVEYKNLEGIDCEVEWEDGQISKLSSNDNKRHIDYIPQMHLNNIAEDKEKNITFKQTIDELLHKQPGYTNALHELQSKILEKNQILSNEIDKYFDNGKELKRLESELSLLGDKKAIEATIAMFKAELQELKSKSNLTPEDELEIKKINDLISEEEKKKTTLNNDIVLFEGTKKVFENLNLRVSNFIDEEFANVVTTSENKIVLENIKINLSKQLISTIDSIKSANPFNTETLRTSILQINENIDKLKLSLEPYNEKFNDKKKFLDTQKKLADEEEKLRKISQKEIEIVSQKSKLNLKVFISRYDELFDSYNKIIELNEPYKLIGKDLELITEIKFDKEKFYSNFSFFITKNQTLDKLFNATIYNNKNEFLYDSETHIEKINDILLKLFEGTLSFNQSKTLKEMITYLFDDYFKVTYDLKQGYDRLEGMSPGKKGIILFQLFLEISSTETPILIDQPEDNLDNRTVYNTLNEFIKNKKLDRQIIMVSHNSNLVVSTDSENIIVANQNGQEEGQVRFDYINGALENTFKNQSVSTSVLKSQGIREHVFELLEGGEIAFKKREQKYNIKKG